MQITLFCQLKMIH